MTHQKRELDMTHGPLIGKLLLYTFPLMLSGILQLLFNAADVIVVGRFSGGDALAAVGATNSLINLIVNLFMGLAVGVSVNVAHAWGAKREDIVEKTVHTAILTALICGTFVMLVGVFGCRTFLTWMGTPDNIIDLSTLYMRIYFLGIPASMVYNFGAAVLRSIGDTRRPLYFLIIAGIVNVCLNLVMVIGFQMSVAGVAIATIVSQIISAVLVLIFLSRQDNCCRLSLKNLRIHKERLFAIIRIGVPSGIQSSLFAISNVLIQSSINSFGSVAMEGNTAAGNLEGFVYIAMNSFYHTTLTFIGQNIGAKQYKRIPRILISCLILVFILGLILGALLNIFNVELLSIYTSGDSPEMIQYGVNRLRIIASTYFLCGLMEVFTGALRGMGTSLTPMLMSVFGVCCMRVAWIYTAFAYSRTLTTLYFSYPISWLVTILLELVAFFFVYRNFLKKHSHEDAQKPDRVSADA